MATPQSLSGRKLLITGATGYMGSWLAEYARREGAEVRLLVRRVPDYLRKWASQFEVVTADICGSDDLADAVRNRDLVWHAASVNETRAESDPGIAISTNVAGTERVLSAARDAGVSVFLKFSTFHVYGHEGVTPLVETEAARPRGVYGLTNLMGDEVGLYFHRRYGMDVRILRVSNGYGAPIATGIDRWSLVLNDLTRMAWKDGEIVLRSSGLQHRDFVSVPDVFDAVCRLSEPELQHRIYHVGGGTSKSILDVAKLVQTIYQDRYGKSIALRAPEPADTESSHPVVYDISRLRSLGFEPADRMAVEIGRIFDLLEAASSEDTRISTSSQ